METIYHHDNRTVRIDADGSRESHCINHHSSPTIEAYQDYLILCHLSEVKASLLLRLDLGDVAWVPVTDSHITRIAKFCGSTPAVVTAALTELIAERFVERQAEGDRVTYRLNKPVVQQALTLVLTMLERWSEKLGQQ